MDAPPGSSDFYVQYTAGEQSAVDLSQSGDCLVTTRLQAFPYMKQLQHGPPHKTTTCYFYVSVMD